MRKTNFFCLILGLTILIFCQTGFSQNIKTNVQKAVQTKCVSYIEQFELCINSLTISTKIDKAVILTYSIKNISGEQLLAPDSRFGRFTLRMTDEKGNKIPSIAEVISEKARKGEPLTKEESRNFISGIAYSGHGERDFDPYEERKSLLSLSNLYYFKTKGEYLVKVYRKPLKYAGRKEKEKFLLKIKVEIE